ncbi:tape measure protein, partial [Romboutsia sp.]|uniref:tape measure protein n=1 Tax=Romboutsia sp. TaxID=1965302 RepID=UPI002C7494D9
MGGGTEELNGVATALSQMSMKGKISAEEMQQLAERGIPAYKLLAESMGVSEATLMDMMKDGEVMSKEALPLLIGQMDKAFGGSMKKNVGSFNANVSTLKDTFRGVMGQLSKPLFDKLNQGMNNIIPMLMKFKDALSGEGGFMGAIKKFAPGIMPFVQLAISIFKSMGDTVGVIIKSMSSFWNEHKGWLMPVITFLFTFISSIVTNTITAIGAIVQSGLAVVDGIINFFQNLFKGNFSGCWESIKQIFFGALEFVWNLMQVQFALNIPAMIKGFGKGAIGIFKGMWSSVKGFFGGGIKACLGFVKNLLSGAKSNFGTLKAFGANSFQALWSIAKSMMSNLLKSVTSSISKVPTTIKNFMTRAVGVIKGINLFSIGKDMIQGLINGIKNAGANIAGAIGNVVNSAVESTKKKLKIKSPSRVFMEIGKFTGEGLAIGIENEKDRVSKASIGLSKSVIGGYSAKLKGLSGSFKADTASNNKNVNINVQNMNVVDKGDKNRTLSQLSFLATV